MTAEAGLSMKVAVAAVVLALLSELTADKLDTGMLTRVPAGPLGMDKGSWMSSGCPEATMPLPGAVFSSRVPVGLWLVMPVARVDAALEEEVISWRIGVCVTMAVEVGAEAVAAAGAARVVWI